MHDRESRGNLRVKIGHIVDPLISLNVNFSKHKKKKLEEKAEFRLSIELLDMSKVEETI